MALLVGAAALMAGALALVVTGRPSLGASVFLDLLLAAGLLRLVGEPSWRALATAASIIAIRRLVGSSLRIGGRSWTLGSGERTAARRRSLRRRLGTARRE